MVGLSIVLGSLLVLSIVINIILLSGRGKLQKQVDSLVIDKRRLEHEKTNISNRIIHEISVGDEIMIPDNSDWIEKARNKRYEVLSVNIHDRNLIVSMWDNNNNRLYASGTNNGNWVIPFDVIHNVFFTKKSKNSKQLKYEFK